MGFKYNCWIFYLTMFLVFSCSKDGDNERADAPASCPPNSIAKEITSDQDTTSIATLKPNTGSQAGVVVTVLPSHCVWVSPVKSHQQSASAPATTAAPTSSTSTEESTDSGVITATPQGILGLTAISTTVAYGEDDSIIITAVNSGSGIISDLSFAAASGYFTDNGGTCAETLGSGSSCTHIITFTPPGSGAFSQTLDVTYDDGLVNKSSTITIEAIGTNKILTLAPVYPTNGADWNDYVKWEDVNLSAYQQVDTACNGTETEFRQCIHGGELKKMVITGVTSCNGLIFADYLNAFNWRCSDTSGTATIYSFGLKDGKGLRDLVDNSGWKSNHLQVSKDGFERWSSSGNMWNNIVTPLPDNAASVAALTSAGSIYVLTTSRSTAGYNINADRIGLVVTGDAILSFNPSAGNNCDASGNTDGATTMKCLVGVGTQKFVWIEGNFEGYYAAGGANFGVTLFTTIHSQIRNSKFQNFSASATALSLGSASNYNLVKNVVFGRSGGTSISVVGSNNIVTETYGAGASIYLMNITGQLNFITRFQGVSNSSAAFGISHGGDRNTGAFFTLASGSVDSNRGALYIFRNNYNTISNLLLTNQNGDGLKGGANSASGRLLVANALTSNLASTAVIITTQLKENKFTGYLLFGNNGVDCIGGAGFGINNDCSTEGTSDFSIASTTISTANTFVGKVSSNDSANISDNSGARDLADITDFINFESPFRAWGKDGTYGDSSSQGVCVDGCRIWDWRLSASDTVARNKSGNGIDANDAFTAGAACPSAVNGNVTLTDQMTAPNTFLKNAIEIIGDFIGDDDGLCESGEACIYAPNIGAYQGEGDYYAAGTCIFDDGVVTGVSMYAYPTNGL